MNTFELTEIGDEPLSVEDGVGLRHSALNLIQDRLSSAKVMAATEQHEGDGAVKQEVLIKDLRLTVCSILAGRTVSARTPQALVAGRINPLHRLRHLRETQHHRPRNTMPLHWRTNTRAKLAEPTINIPIIEFSGDIRSVVDEWNGHHLRSQKSTATCTHHHEKNCFVRAVHE